MVDLAAVIWDDYNTTGVPGSGAKLPVKAKIREWGTDLEDRLALAVAGPASATDNEILRADETTGKLLKAGSGVYIDDNGIETVGRATLSTSGDLQYTSRQNYGAAGKAGGCEAVIQNSADASCAFFGMFKSRHATKGSHTVLQTLDDLGELSFHGSDGTNFVKSAIITPRVDGTPGSGVMPTRIGIWNMDAAGVLQENLRIQVDRVVSLLAGQLRFPAVQNPSADVNTLDDYEEGTFTPSLLFGGAAVSLTYGYRLGKYTKVGNLVTYWAEFQLSAKGSSTGNATISGLPFTSGSGYAAAGSVTGFTMASQVDGMRFEIASATSAMLLTIGSATGDVVATQAHFNNTSRIIITGQYMV